MDRILCTSTASKASNSKYFYSQLYFQGNMDKDFVLERKDMLNNFIRHLAKYKFFVESWEFGIFASYTGDLLEK